MGGEQLTLLEQRIEKAINLIEELKGREKRFKNEKILLERRIKELQNEIETKDDIIDELKRSQRFLKEKIEVILDKLESIEIFETTSDFEYKGANANKNENVIESFNETKIIEDDNVVDLKEIGKKDHKKDHIEEKSTVSDSSLNKESNNIAEGDETADKKEELEDISIKEKKSDKSSIPHVEKNHISKESIRPEEDLKIIDGGKSLFEEGVKDNIDNQNHIQENNETGEGFLFNTGNPSNRLKSEDKWFENNPFI